MTLQKKPDAIDFYWDGIKALLNKWDPSTFLLIHQYQIFSKSPSIENLSLFLQVFCDHIRIGKEDLLESAMDLYADQSHFYGKNNYLTVDLKFIISDIGLSLAKSLIGSGVNKESGQLYYAHLLTDIFIAAELITKPENDCETRPRKI